MGDGPSVLVTLRLSARDRALLEQLVERERQELEELGVEVSLSSVMRKLIRAAAKASAIDLAADKLPRRGAPMPGPPPPPSTTSAPSQDQVRALLRKKMAERRGLGAELARKLGVERAGVEVQGREGAVSCWEACRAVYAPHRAMKRGVRKQQPEFVVGALAALHAAALAAGVDRAAAGEANYMTHLHGMESPPSCTAKPCPLGGLCLAIHELTQHKNEARLSMAVVDAAHEASTLSATLERFLVGLAPVLQRVDDAHRRIPFHDHDVCIGAVGVLAPAIELGAQLGIFETTMRRLVWSRQLQQPPGKKSSELLLTAVYQHLRWGGFKYGEIEPLVLGKKASRHAADRARARVKAPNARSLMPYEAEKFGRAIPPPDRGPRGGHAPTRR